LGGFGQLDEYAIVDLKKSEELEDLARLGGNLVDTLDSHDEDKLGLVFNKEGALLLADAGESNLLTLRITILLHVLLGTLEDDIALLLVGLLFLFELRAALLSGLLLALSLLQQGLRNEDLVLRGDRSARTRISIVRVIKIAESELQLWCGILKLVIGITRRDRFDR
jgi:hypothetical protein